jgi:hypothetical protein
MCVLLLLTAAEQSKALRQDFESAPVGALPKGWTAAKTGEGEGSVWKIVEDPTAPKGARALAQTAEGPGQLYNLCVHDESNFKDVEISVAFKSVKGEGDQGGGVVWRFSDPKNYYIARYNPLESNYRVYKVVDGKRTQLATVGGLKLAASEWHTLSIRMKENEITCSLDGQKHLEAKDDTFTKAGKVGLWTKADAQTFFDDFQAKPIGE